MPGELVYVVRPGAELDDDERALLASAVGVENWRSLRTIKRSDVRPGYAYLVELEEDDDDS